MILSSCGKNNRVPSEHYTTIKKLVETLGKILE